SCCAWLLGALGAGPEPDPEPELEPELPEPEPPAAPEPDLLREPPPAAPMMSPIVLARPLADPPPEEPERVGAEPALDRLALLLGEDAARFVVGPAVWLAKLFCGKPSAAVSRAALVAGPCSPGGAPPGSGTGAPGLVGSVSLTAGWFGPNHE